MNNEIKDFIIRYFKGKKLPKLKNETEILEYKYLENGLIDSMGIVDLINSMENRFSIVFSIQNMQDPEFGKVGGLISMVERLRNKLNE
ncbi:MAG: hypothetical protein HQM08_21775 [Candidatus Riflebacteria bacterium]|nr:hypothetical protein [Candidatus Riflebacteria bacterium]